MKPTESYQTLPKHNILLTHFLSSLIPFLITLSISSNCVQLFQGQRYTIIFFLAGVLHRVFTAAHGPWWLRWAPQSTCSATTEAPERPPGCTGFRTCGTGAQQLWLTGPSVHRLQQLWHTGLIAPQGSFWTRDQTHGPLHRQADSYPLYHQENSCHNLDVTEIRFPKGHYLVTFANQN